MSNFKGIYAGDRVTYTTRDGKERTGVAQMLLCFPDHVVVNMGGPHGTPAVVNEHNYVRHTSGRKGTP